MRFITDIKVPMATQMTWATFLEIVKRFEEQVENERNISISEEEIVQLEKLANTLRIKMVDK